VAGGQLHLGSTTIAGERYLRLVITAPTTDESTLATLLEALRAARVRAAA
jgi:hypothetical protein